MPSDRRRRRERGRRPRSRISLGGWPGRAGEPSGRPRPVPPRGVESRPGQGRRGVLPGCDRCLPRHRRSRRFPPGPRQVRLGRLAARRARGPDRIHGNDRVHRSDRVDGVHRWHRRNRSHRTDRTDRTDRDRPRAPARQAEAEAEEGHRLGAGDRQHGRNPAAQGQPGREASAPEAGRGEDDTRPGQVESEGARQAARAREAGGGAAFPLQGRRSARGGEGPQGDRPQEAGGSGRRVTPTRRPAPAVPRPRRDPAGCSRLRAPCRPRCPAAGGA